MTKPIVRLWTGCELYAPIEIAQCFDGGTQWTVRIPEHGDSFTFITQRPMRLDDLVQEIEAGVSLLSWQVMGWFICTRRNRWMRAAEERARPFTATEWQMRAAAPDRRWMEYSPAGQKPHDRRRKDRRRPSPGTP